MYQTIRFFSSYDMPHCAHASVGASRTRTQVSTRFSVKIRSALFLTAKPVRILRQMEQYSFSSRKSRTWTVVPFDKVYFFSWEILGAVVSEVVLDDTYALHFIEEEDDYLPMVSMAAWIAWRSPNRRVSWVFRTGCILLIHWMIDEFQREVVGTGVLPVGNPFGTEVIDARKQVLIFLWCIANQETTQLIARSI